MDTLPLTPSHRGREDKRQKSHFKIVSGYFFNHFSTLSQPAQLVFQTQILYAELTQCVEIKGIFFLKNRLTFLPVAAINPRFFMGGLQTITFRPLTTNPAAGLAGTSTIQGGLRPTAARDVFLRAAQRGDASAIRILDREVGRMLKRRAAAIHVTRFEPFNATKIRETLDPQVTSAGELAPGQILVVESMSEPNTPQTTTRPTRHGINGFVNGEEVTTAIVSGETTPPNGTRVRPSNGSNVGPLRSLSAASEASRSSTPPPSNRTPPPAPPSDVKPEHRAEVFGEALAHAMNLFCTVIEDARRSPRTERDAMNALIILDRIGEATDGWGLKSAFESGFFVNEWAKSTVPQHFGKVSFLEGVTARARILLFLNELKGSHPDFVANHFDLLMADTQEGFAQNLSNVLEALEAPVIALEIRSAVRLAAHRLARLEAAAVAESAR